MRIRKRFEACKAVTPARKMVESDFGNSTVEDESHKWLRRYFEPLVEQCFTMIIWIPSGTKSQFRQQDKQKDVLKETALN